MMFQADVDSSVQKGACGNHHAATVKTDAALGHNPASGRTVGSFLKQHIVYRLLKKPQSRLLLKASPHRVAIQDAVSLRSRGPYCRPFARIQDAKLYARFIGDFGHQPAHRINFAYQMPLPDPADRRITRHLAKRFELMREQKGCRAHPRARTCRLRTSVSSTDNDDIKVLGIIHWNPSYETGNIALSARKRTNLAELTASSS